MEITEYEFERLKQFVERLEREIKELQYKVQQLEYYKADTSHSHSSERYF